jgi:hypothetical protein
MVDAEISNPEPKSLIPEVLLGMLTPPWRKRVEKCAKDRPGLFGHDEKVLKKMLAQIDAHPTYIDNMIRLHFWREYDINSEKGFTQIRPVTVFAGVMDEYLFNLCMDTPAKVAWMLCPIIAYDTRLKEALAFSTEQMREILEMPSIDGKGKLNTALISLKMRIHNMLDVKINGLAVQRIEQKNLNVNVPGSGLTPPDLLMKDDMAYLRKKLRELELYEEKAAKGLIPGPKPKEDIVIETSN